MNTASVSRSGRQLLLIAGEEIDVPVLLADLEHFGYSVQAIVTELGTLPQILADFKPNLVLISLISSTQKDGSESCIDRSVLRERIAAAVILRQEQDIPAIFLVDTPSRECLALAREASPLGFVFLPYQRLQLHVTIETACEHAEIETRLKQQEKRYREIVENSPVGIFQTTMDGRYLSLNRSLANSLGYATAEELLTSVENIEKIYLHPERRQKFIQQGLETDGFVEIENMLKRRDGSTKISLVQYRVVRDGQGLPDYIEGFSQDITVRKRAEEALIALNQQLLDEIAERRRTEEVLRASEDRYLSFLENFEGIAFRLRRVDGNRFEPVFYHGAVIKISGYREEDLLQGQPRWDTLLHPDDQYLVPGRLYETAVEESLIDREYRIVRQDGQVRWVHEVARFVQDENSGEEYVQGAIYDVTMAKQREFEIRAVASVSSRLSIATRRDEIPLVLLQQVNQLLHTRGAALILYDAETKKATCEMGTGVWEHAMGKQMPEEDVTYRVLEERRFYLNNDALSIAGMPGFKSDMELRGLACVPLVAQKQMIGALWVAKTSPVTGEELRAFAAIGDMAASVLQQSNLFDKLQQAYDNTLEGWALALELRDHETQGHSIRVAEATVRLARALGLHGEDLVDVRRGALLHDIGKIAVPDEILLKPGPLNERERETMQMHPVYANEMLGAIKFLQKAVEIPYNHHEHWDGNGYPRGIRGLQIPLSARIFAIIDVWDSLLSERPYRPSWPRTKVFDYLLSQKGRQFDPQVVDAFFKVFGSSS